MNEPNYDTETRVTLAEDYSNTLALAKQDSTPRTIRFQLLLAVNATMAVLVVGFLAYHYWRGLSERLEEKHIALEEELKTLLPAVLRFRPSGLDAVQDYVDAVCVRMQDTQSPGHHIAAQWATS